MKLRRSFSSQQLIFAIGLTLSMASLAPAQDKLVTSNNQTQEGKIVGVSGANVQIQIGAGTISFPLNQVTSVTMAPPAEFTAGKAAYDTGDNAKAFASIKAVVDKFKGLPTPWAQEATSLLGDIYVALDKLPEAEKAYLDFQKTYGGKGSSPLQSEVGLARIAVSKKEYDKARERLDPITSDALTKSSFTRSEALAISQAFCLLGQTAEASQQWDDALQSYLRVIAIFPADTASVTLAQERANAIRKEHNIAFP